MNIKKQPLVSIIIPAYNAATLIRETIASILHQTYKNLEIIVVDDGSKDNTPDVVRDLIESKKIIYIRQENQGQAAARKNGFEISKGEFIGFLDADDLIAPEKIELQVDHMMKNPECGVCYSDIAHFWHHKQDELLHKKLEYYEGYIFEKILKNNLIQVATALIRRSVLEKWGVPGARFRRSDDWYLWLNLAKHSVRFDFIKKILAFQRRQEQGTLSDQKTYFKETADVNISVYRELKKEYGEQEAKKYQLDELINFWLYRKAIGCLILEDKKGARSAVGEIKKESNDIRMKKVIILCASMLVPGKILAASILWLREILKRKSFQPLKDASIVLPNRQI